MAEHQQAVPSSLWVQLGDSRIEAYQASGANVAVAEMPDGGFRLPALISDGAWSVRPVFEPAGGLRSVLSHATIQTPELVLLSSAAPEKYLYLTQDLALGSLPLWADQITDRELEIAHALLALGTTRVNRVRAHRATQANQPDTPKGWGQR